MKIYTQLLKIRIFKIHKVSIQLLISLLFVLGAGNVFAQDKVLNIYFCGTSMTENMHIPGNPTWHNASENSLKNPTELIANLYHNDNSESIKREYNAVGLLTKISIIGGENHYKFIARGIGTDPLSFYGVALPDNAIRGWDQVELETSKALDLVDSICTSEDKIILNLIGFSRGGILTMRMARRVKTNPKVSEINILAYDPVPGDLSPQITHGDFVLPEKVNQYIGIYAQDERSLFFEPVIPRLNNKTKVWLTSVAGSHETMVGNCQKDGHSVHPLDLLGLLDNSYIKEMEFVTNIAKVIGEQLITSKEWGGYEDKIATQSELANRNDFLSQIDRMNKYNDWGNPKPLNWDLGKVRTTFFTGAFTIRVAEIRGSATFPLLPPNDRLCFKAPLNGLLGIDKVYWLNNHVEKMNLEAWDKLQALRGDYDPPVPTVDPLPDIIGECMAEITTIPTAYDEYTKETINGTTTDPLIYTEQGTYTVTWSYDDGNGNVATQEQTVIVEDVTPPTIEKLLAYSFTIYPSNYITEEVPQWPVNYKNGILAERPRKRLNRDDFMLLRHQRKYETIKVDELVESVSDNCSNLSPNDVIITKVTCDEAEDTRLPIRFRNEDDIIIADDCKSVDLRRRSDARGNGRVYTVHLSLKDEVGNEAIESCDFSVLFSLPAKMASTDASAYEAHSACYETDGQPTDILAGISTKSSQIEEIGLSKDQVVPEVGYIKNYPNPFNSYTTFAFGVTKKSDVTLSIYNLQGQLIRVLYSGSMNPGSMNVDWDGSDANGNKMTSGIYIYRLLANNTIVSSGKTVLKK